MMFSCISTYDGLESIAYLDISWLTELPEKIIRTMNLLNMSAWVIICVFVIVWGILFQPEDEGVEPWELFGGKKNLEKNQINWKK